MNRASILKEVDNERDNQIALGYTEQNDKFHVEASWIAILCRHLGLAAGDAGWFEPRIYRRQLIRVAALAVAAVEALDKKQEKVADHSIKGSGV